MLNSMTGGDTLTLLTAQYHASNIPAARCGYILSASDNASYVITATWGTTADFRRGIIMEFTYSGTASADGQAAASAEDDNDATPSSNTITTTGTDELCIGFHTDSTTQAFSLETINRGAAGGNTELSDINLFYKVFSATFTGGAASLTRDSIVDREWVQQLMCFKATGILQQRPIPPIFLQ